MALDHRPHRLAECLCDQPGKVRTLLKFAVFLLRCLEDRLGVPLARHHQHPLIAHFTGPDGGYARSSPSRLRTLGSGRGALLAALLAGLLLNPRALGGRLLHRRLHGRGLLRARLSGDRLLLSGHHFAPASWALGLTPCCQASMTGSPNARHFFRSAPLDSAAAISMAS